MALSKIIPAHREGRRLIFFSLLFLGSGAAGLIYEIIWERLLELYFGVTMTAITLIVAAYMAGLGLGSLYGGRIAEKRKSSLLLYGLVELGIGTFGFLSPGLILKVGQATAGSPYWLVFVLSFFLLLIPTFLMGLTLPFLSQAFVHRVETSGQVIGILYGINTIGAALGTLLAGYVLIGFLGFDGSINVACGLNIGVGLLALIASRQTDETSSKPNNQPRTLETQSLSWGYSRILFASFLVGFIGLGFEMLWIRILSIVNKNTAYGFPSILFVFLVGLSLGGYYWGRRADRSPNIARLFWSVEIGVGLIASLTFLLFWYSLVQGWQSFWLRDFWQMQKPLSPMVEVNNSLVFSRRMLVSSIWNYFLPVIILVLPSSFLMGGGLPILDRIAINSPEVAGRRVGDVHLANIVGSVAGSLAISFLLLPVIGSEITHKILVLLSFVFPLLFFTPKATQKSRPTTNSFSPYMIAASALLLFITPGKGLFYSRLFEVGTGRNAIIDESKDTVLALTLNPEFNQPEWLWISGETNSFYPTDGTYESRALLCAGASHPRRILVIGMGGGITAHFFQTVPGIQKIVIVELIDELGNFLYDQVEFNRITLDNPLVEYVVDDGRRYLQANPGKKFDLIYADPLRWYTAGHNNLYSMEAMQLYRSHLTENGVFCAYVDQQNVIPNTITNVFQESDQFRFRTVVASQSVIQYDLPYMESITENYRNPQVMENINPKNLLAQYSRSHEQILSDEKKLPILTDLDPWLEYYFFNTPARTPVWPKGESRNEFLNRIEGCDSTCQSEIFEGVNNNAE